MKNILHLFKRDVQNVSHSVIGLVVVMASLSYRACTRGLTSPAAGIRIGNTGNLKIAVVNTDEGYESDRSPVEVNVGENVTATLRGNESFDWVVLNNPRQGYRRASNRAHTMRLSLSLRRLVPI